MSAYLQHSTRLAFADRSAWPLAKLQLPALWARAVHLALNFTPLDSIIMFHGSFSTHIAVIVPNYTEVEQVRG